MLWTRGKNKQNWHAKEVEEENDRKQSMNIERKNGWNNKHQRRIYLYTIIIWRKLK